MLLLYLQLLSLGYIFDETWYRLPSTPTKLLSAHHTNGVPGSGGDDRDDGGDDGDDRMMVMTVMMVVMVVMMVMVMMDYGEGERHDGLTTMHSTQRRMKAKNLPNVIMMYA